MELTFESAFSTGGLVGHMAYVLLVISMLMRTMVLLRILVILSSLVAVLYAVIWLGDPVTLFWESMLIAVNVVQLFLIWWYDRRARFSQDESAFVSGFLHGLSPGDARRLLDLGTWRDAPAGTVLTTEGMRPRALTFLLRGTARIRVGERQVATVGAGQFVGEMSVFDAGAASATAEISEPARVWQLPVEVLDDLLARKAILGTALEAAIARNMRDKLIASNAAAARAAVS